MSYILEALKKSQQERELGRVPTIDVLPMTADGPDTRPSYWGAAAVVLAALAVMIALYAAFRGSPSAPQPPAITSGPAQAPQTAPASPATEPVPTAPVTARPEPQSAPAERVAEAGSGVSPATPSSGGSPDEGPATSSEGVQRPAARKPQAPPVVAEPAQRRDKVPEDLRQDIEAFKEQVRGTRSKGREAEAPTEKIPPQKLELPKEVAARMPTLIMTVHIYDEDPSKRFVLINGRKIREGRRTREGVEVEEVLPDGAVLSYDGHRFFRHR
jgi:general secretion pathway protein B